MSELGKTMYEFAAKLYPIYRSLTGQGVRDTLHLVRELVPDLSIHEIPSGTRVFDWTVPDEWNIHDAYVLDASGRRVIDFREHNLHVVGYSEPVRATVSLEKLNAHLYSLPEQPDAIPYVTSYYRRTWGFCIQHRKREQLPPGQYTVVIDSTLAPGVLNYGEVILPGDSDQEVLLSTYVCHPSMANNEVSGPVVTTYLARWLSERRTRRYTYRILFLPETIGAVAYLSRHLAVMKARTIAGFMVTCVGDDRTYSFVPSRRGDSLADRTARHVLKHQAPQARYYSFLDRGSDERQYCSVGVDLPVVSIMRSKYREYPEYHTSLDDLSFISPEGLGGSFDALVKCLRILEHNRHYVVTVPCEPQLGRRGLYPNLSMKGSSEEARVLKNLVAYADGSLDLLGVAETLGVSFDVLLPSLEKLLAAGLLTEGTRFNSEPWLAHSGREY